MWTCPVCGRSFKNTSQNHSCVKPENIDDYISRQPEDRRDCLTRIRTVIAAAIPQAKECIAWSMPTFSGKADCDSVCCRSEPCGPLSRPRGC